MMIHSRRLSKTEIINGIERLHETSHEVISLMCEQNLYHTRRSQILEEAVMEALSKIPYNCAMHMDEVYTILNNGLERSRIKIED